MKIIVINLDRDVERLGWMRLQVASLGLEFERFQALTPATMPEDIRTRFRPEAFGRLTAGEVGCFASHIRIAQLLLESADDYWLVLEDDIEFDWSAYEMMALGEACADQMLVKLNDWPKTPSLQLRRIGRHRLVRYWAAPRGTGAHFLTRRGAAALLDCAHDIDLVADDFLRENAHSQLAITGVVPPPAIQDRFRESSIDPARTREKSPRRRRPTGNRRRRQRLAEMIAGIRLFGVMDAIRLLAATIAMRLRRVKRDTDMRYVVSSRN